MNKYNLNEIVSLVDGDLPIVRLIAHEDGRITLEWDDTDPRCAEINKWTEQDWIDAIEDTFS